MVNKNVEYITEKKHRPKKSKWGPKIGPQGPRGETTVYTIYPCLVS